MIPIFKLYLPKHVLKYAHDAIDSTWISSIGKYIQLSQEKLREIVGVKHVLLVNNGTSAVHLVAKALKFKYPHIRNIIVPNNVYVAAWNGFLFDKDFVLNPIDANIDTWNFDTSKIDSPEAILCVHNLGNMIDVTSLKLKFPNAIFVEDNCEGFGGLYSGKHSGTESLCSAMSFYANKNITSGEGGAVYTNDNEVMDFITKVYNHGRSDIQFVHDALGHNYRMTNIQASLLYGQLVFLDEIKERKRFVFDNYRKLLQNNDNIVLQVIEKNTIHSNFLVGVRVLKNESFSNAYRFFYDRGIEIRPMFYPMSAHKHLAQYSKDETNATLLSKQCFIIPNYPDLTLKEMDYIADTVKDFSK